MPDYLEQIPAAEAIWYEEFERICAHGITADHSSTFATYCVLEATIRSAVVTGKLPTGNIFTERRKLAELLGIGGLANRSAGNALNPVQDSNPFGALPDA